MSDTIYCYPHSNVLMNKLKITEPEELQNAEIEMTSNYLYALQLQPIKGKFDFKHLCAIHKHIFQDLYPWAGQPRTVNIGKGNLFCLVQHIQTYADSIFSGYYKDCMTVKENPDEFIHTLTNYYSDVNALHPFREGNGRSQREFARELCLKCGYVFDLTQTNHENMLEASIESFNTGDNTKLENIFQRAVVPVTEYPNLQQTLQSKIMILSKDDIPTKTSHDERMKELDAKFGHLTEETTSEKEYNPYNK